MTKKVITLLSFLILTALNAQEVTERMTIPGPLDYAGTEFLLTRSSHPSKVLYVQDYIPRDATLADFGEMVPIYYFQKDINIEDAVKQKVQEIQRKMENDKFASVNLTESPDGSDFVVDYVITKSPEGKTPSAEFNIYRFKEINNGTSKDLMILVYTKRSNGDLKTLTKNFSKSKNFELDRMIGFKVPELKIIEGTELTK